jgi:hypothetical protein
MRVDGDDDALAALAGATVSTVDLTVECWSSAPMTMSPQLVDREERDIVGWVCERGGRAVCRSGRRRRGCSGR